jgi:hypothetical protein
MEAVHNQGDWGFSDRCDLIFVIALRAPLITCGLYGCPVRGLRSPMSSAAAMTRTPGPVTLPLYESHEVPKDG